MAIITQGSRDRDYLFKIHSEEDLRIGEGIQIL